MNEKDPYVLHVDSVAEPPHTWWGCLGQCGPGLILSASIVGAGELITTTTLGAKVGFIALWIVVLSCFAKVALQLEFGRHTIQHGETCIAALNQLPGLRIAKTHWTIWVWLLLQPIKILQLGAILGGVAIVLNMAVPSISMVAWCWVTAVTVAAMVSWGKYRFVESASLFFLMGFTLATVISVVTLQWTPYAIEAADITSGFQGKLPQGALLFAFATFGLTGVGGDEIMHYSYWLLEKGYAARTGPYRPDDPDWANRAKRWVRIMYLDALLSMVAYTLVTAAFYLLGAAVLHDRGTVPGDFQLIETLASMYTESIGAWGRTVLLIGAFFVLFSSLFAALAAWSRMYVDVFGALGLSDFGDMKRRRREVIVWSWILALSWGASFVWLGKPVSMVVWGGIATAVILLEVVVAVLHFRYRRTRSQLIPGRFYDAALWISVTSILALAIYGLLTSLGVNPFGTSSA
jgi:manganese transport protein